MEPDIVTHPLAQLIDSVKATNEWSDPDLVNNAAKKGHALTKSNISRYRNEDPLISVKGTVIRALAAGLGVTVDQVATAAMESMGIALPTYEGMSPEQAVRTDPTLSQRDKKLALSVLRELRKEGAHNVAALPTSPEQGTPGETDQDEKNLADEAESPGAAALRAAQQSAISDPKLRGHDGLKQEG